MEYTPAQASAVANLPLPAVHKLIERRLIRPRRLRTGRSVQRMLTREQVLYLRLEAEGVRLLPIAQRERSEGNSRARRPRAINRH